MPKLECECGATYTFTDEQLSANGGKVFACKCCGKKNRLPLTAPAKEPKAVEADGPANDQFEDTANGNRTRKATETFWQLIWRVAKHPLARSSDPLVQSAAAFGINLWCLVVAVLAQFWVFLSAGLLLSQTYNTWLVANGRMKRSTALLFGLILVAINFGALTLAVLGQFWVFASAALSAWQYVSLIRVCLARPANNQM